MRIARGVLVVVSTLVVGLLLAVPGPSLAGSATVGGVPEADGAAQERARPQSFLSFNIAGGKQHDGRVHPIVDEVVRAVRGRGAKGAVLNEVCGTQARALKRRLDGYRVHFFRTSERLCGGRSIGNVVIAEPGSVKLPNESRRLPSTGRYQRQIGCVRMSPTSGSALCGTHLSFGDTSYKVRNAQAKAVSEVAESLVANGFAVIVAGDLNAEPGSPIVRHLYSGAYPKGRGQLAESAGCCARSGPATTPGGRKIDYLFHSAAWTRVGSEVVPTRRSDHYKVWLSATR